MIRYIIIHGLLLVTPLVAWTLYARFIKRHKEEEGEAFDETPWSWLLGTGLALMIASMSFMALSDRQEPGANYVPAETRDGEIVPGHYE